MLVTPTVGAEEGKIHHSLPNIIAAGSTDLMAGLSVAGLALKHRQDKNQRQRAVVLLGSPLPPSLSSDELVRLGKRLKKNNVAVDVVLYGAEATENEERMRAFVEAVNSGGNSTFVVVPPGAPGLLSDHIRQSEILREDLGYTEGPAAGAAGGGDGSLDLDPNLDPELAMVRAPVLDGSRDADPIPLQALRMSLQDEEARQAAAAAASAGPSAPAASASEPQPTEPAVPTAEAEKVTAEALPPQADDSMGEDDAELARALALSRGEDVECAPAL